MDKKTPNKRKSLANAKETPNKIRKTTTPVSQKVNNKSPKFRNKNNQQQIKESTKSKSNKNQKTSQVQKNNTKIATPKGRKLTKQIEEDETDDESDELNGTNGNDAVNSDNEVEASSDEGAENGESGSDQDAENDETVSDEEADNGEADAGEEAENDEANPNRKAKQKNVKDVNLTVYVKAVNPKLKVENIFKNCNIDKFTLYTLQSTNGPLKCGTITFKDKESYMTALTQHGNRYGDYELLVYPYCKRTNTSKHTKFMAFVTNLKNIIKAEEVFQDCKIVRSTRYKIQNIIQETAIVSFENEQSLQKALLQHETVHDGQVIKVFRCNCSVLVNNLNVDSRLEDVFEDCNIHAIELRNNGQAQVNFKDTESLQKALAKNNTVIDGNTIQVEVTKRKSQNTGYVKPTSRNSDNPTSKVEILKKKILLEELKIKAQKLQQEIYKQSKPFSHRKQQQK